MRHSGITDRKATQSRAQSLFLLVMATYKITFELKET